MEKILKENNTDTLLMKSKVKKNWREEGKTEWRKRGKMEEG